MNTPRTSLYRDSQNGKIMGVCAGISEYTGMNAAMLRLIMIALTIAFGFPLLLYVVAGIVLPKKPAHLYSDKQEQKYWQGVRQSPTRTAREIRSRFRDIDRRLAAVEEYYVSNNPRLTAEIEELR